MLQMPRRSVTRFFIPLIDVLTLLFCVFLIMPLVRNPTEEGPDLRDKTPQEQVEYLRLDDELVMSPEKDAGLVALDGRPGDLRRSGAR